MNLQRFECHFSLHAHISAHISVAKLKHVTTFFPNIPPFHCTITLQHYIQRHCPILLGFYQVSYILSTTIVKISLKDHSICKSTNPLNFKYLYSMKI